MDQSIATNVGARLDRLPFSRTLWLFVLLIALGGVFELYDLFMTAYIAPGLVRAGLYTARPASFFAANGIGFFVFCTFAGMFVGTMGFGFVADRMGRRAIFTYSLLWYSLASAIMAFQHSAEGIDLWRFIASVGIGLEQVTIDTFIPELVPPQGRGRAFALYQFIAFLIVPVVAFLGWLLVPHAPLGLDGWRWIALISAVAALAAWWLRRALPESPRWLARHGELERAEATMRMIEERVARDIGAPLPPIGAILVERAGQSRFAELFRAPYLKRTVMMSLFNSLSVVGYYGFAAWVPTLLIDKGIHVTTSLLYAFIIAIANPIGPLLGFLVADRMERKWQLVCSSVGIGAFMLLFALQTNDVAIIAYGVLVTLSNNWLSFAFHNYQAELYPTRVRARAVGFVYAWGRATAAFVGLLIGFFFRQAGTMGVALFIGVAMVGVIVVIATMGPRTLGQSLEEISQ
ncbi:MAG: MFS transporter [Rhodospirillales bacterium]|nr:MFS transporter [Rhodospirillales bacterium]